MIIFPTNALISGGLTPGNPRAFAILPAQKQDLLTKAHKRPSPRAKEVCSAKSKSALFQKTSIWYTLLYL